MLTIDIVTIIAFILAMGPILPFLPVYGKQLGVSPLIMGSITAILPILFLIAKPAFGFVVDYFRAWRKLIFIALLAATSSCYIFMYFLPALPGPLLPDHQFHNVSCVSLPPCDMDYVIFYLSIIAHFPDNKIPITFY